MNDYEFYDGVDTLNRLEELVYYYGDTRPDLAMRLLLGVLVARHPDGTGNQYPLIDLLQALDARYGKRGQRQHG